MNDVSPKQLRDFRLEAISQPVKLLKGRVGVMLGVFRHARDFDDDDILSDSLAFVAPELRTKESRSQKLTRRMVLLPTGEFSFCEKALLIGGLVRANVDHNDINLAHGSLSYWRNHSLDRDKLLTVGRQGAR